MTWAEFVEAAPELAEDGRALLYQYGVGLAFLATVRADGGPRTHPMCPLVSDRGLFAFLVPSPKRVDLVRDARYAMHSFPAENNEDAFYLTGRARPVADDVTRDELGAQFLAERTISEPPPDFHEQELFEFHIDRCMLTRTTGHGDPNPRHTVWRSPS